MTAIVLSAYAARSCPVKTHNTYDPTIPNATWEPDESLQELFDGGAGFEDAVVDRLLATMPGTVDLRGLREAPSASRQAACLEAIAAKAMVIVAPLLPVDRLGHRAGSPDLLVRGADRADGSPGYLAVEVKWHRIHERKAATKTPRPNSSLSYSTLAEPSPDRAQQRPGLGLRVNSRENDWLQLAHYHRMLEAMGAAAPGVPLAGVIGNDPTFDEPVIGWLDLSEPLIRTFSRSRAEGWKLRSILERYDHELAFRLQVAERALQAGSGAPALVQPIVTGECSRCPWWEHCLPQLPEADVSLQIAKGALDVREIGVLRGSGISTITDLAGADLEALLPTYLPEVRHRTGSEDRLRLAAKRARMLVDGIDLERITSGDIDLPGADLEIDFDIETSVDGRIYLWGFLVTDTRTGGASTFKHFSAFTDLDATGELQLAGSAISWLQELVAGAASVRVYHYSDYEVAKLRQLNESGNGLTSWALDYAEHEFVDLFQHVKEHYFGVRGLGLKVVASRGAGFTWRDDDPGGLNSQRWFIEAVHGETPEIREQARQRVLDYNEDDVTATARVRRWLRTS